MRSVILIAITLSLVAACNNIEDAKSSSRSTFVRFYEGPYNMSAASIEINPDGGYVILANSLVTLTGDTSYVQTVLIQVDEGGNRVGDFHSYDGGTGKSFKRVNNGSFNGYIIVGDSIYINPAAEQAANNSIASLRVLSVDNNFAVQDKEYQSDLDTTAAAIKADYFGGAINIAGPDRVVLVAT